VGKERKGRGGKEVTVVKNLPWSALQLTKFASEIKSKCATGGTIKGSTIEIQGDHRKFILELLRNCGVEAKISGG